MDLLRFHFADQSAHLIAVSETWLHPSLPDALVALPGYMLLRNDRVGKDTGGVGLYIHQALRGKLLAASPSQYARQPEYILVEVRSALMSPLLIAVVYRPPKAANLDKFEQHFDRFALEYSLAVILGDFNADQLGVSNDADNVRDFCTSRSLFPVPFAPTCHTHSSDTLLDLCFLSDEAALHSFSQSVAPFIAPHDLISVELCRPAPPVVAVEYSARSYRDFVQDTFLRELADSDWSVFGTSAAVDEQLRCLQGNLTRALDLHAPHRQCRRRKSRPPWISSELGDLARVRDALYRVYKRTRSVISLLRYRQARDDLHRRISVARSDFYSSRLSSIEQPRMLWKELRGLGLVADRSNGYGDFSVEELNRHFASVSQCPSAASEVTDFFASLPPPLYDDSLFYFRDISPKALMDAVGHFTSQARGVDDISLRNLNDALPVVFPLLLALLNASLSTATFPAQWKRARVLPIGKVKSPSSLQQVRPIANLCLLSKVFERVVLLQISAYLEERGLLDPRQSGFRQGFSTQSALLRLTEDIRQGINDRKLSVVVLFDFTKAFDTVSHAVLLAKLAALGFSQHVLKWVASYLVGRSQAVVGDDGRSSSWAPLDLGVPQGSVLGPLLFSLFVNDLPLVLRHTSHLLYADDLQIYSHCGVEGLPGLIAKVNEDVEAIVGWSKRYGLRLNVAKTQAIIVGSSAYISDLQLAAVSSIFLDGAPVPFSDTVRDLGVWIDSKLSWSKQVAAISARVHASLRQLSAARRFLSLSLRKMLVTSLVLPLFDYCCLVFNLFGVDDTKLQRLMNFCVRFVCGVPRAEHITPHRRGLGWLSLSDRRSYFQLALFFAVTRSGRPSYLRELSVERGPVLYGSSRLIRGDFLIPRFRTESYRNSFTVSSVYLWNALPQHLREARTLSAFKRGLHAHLFGLEAARV